MTDTDNTQPAASNLPSHAVYHVRDREGQKGFWTRIGSAWPHKDGKGFNIKIDTGPFDGRITLRVTANKKS